MLANFVQIEEKIPRPYLQYLTPQKKFSISPVLNPLSHDSVTVLPISYLRLLIHTYIIILWSKKIEHQRDISLKCAGENTDCNS
jgi:hypothetical protein